VRGVREGYCHCGGDRGVRHQEEMQILNFASIDVCKGRRSGRVARPRSGAKTPAEKGDEGGDISDDEKEGSQSKGQYIVLD